MNDSLPGHIGIGAIKKPGEDFGVEELCKFLSSYDLSEEGISNIKGNRISGSMFFELDAGDLKELLLILGDRKLIQKILSSYQPTVVSLM